MNNLLSWIVSNKLLLGMVFSFLFTVGWGVASGLSLVNVYWKDVVQVAENMWISILVLGSLSFLGTSGCYIRNHLKSGQETQNQAIEFNTSAIELTPANVDDVADSIQNKLTEEDLDKEIALFEKRKKLAQLKNEVINLERVSVRASTSENLGQVISVNRGY